MTRDCIDAALQAIGIVIIWAVAIAVAAAAAGPTAGTTIAGALIAAGVITAFAAPGFISSYNRCRRRRS